MTDPSPRTAGPLERWRERVGLFAEGPFAVYWSGGLVSNTGTWLQAVAASVFVYQLTGSVFMVGVLNFVSFLPIVLFSVFGGALADRSDRRWIVIGTSLVAGVLATGLGVLALAGRADVPIVIAVGFLLNTVYAVTKPSISALLPELVPRARLDEAVALNTLQFITGQLLGPLLATLVLAVLGAGEAFLINGLTFVGPIAAMAYLLRRDIGRHPAETVGAVGQPAALRGWRAGVAGLRAGIAGGLGRGVFTYIREQAWIGHMLVTVICTSAAMEVARTTAPALAAEQLGVGESGAGIIVAAQSLGSAVGVLSFVALRRRGQSTQVASVGLVVQAVGLVGLALSGSLLAAIVSVGLVGLGFSFAFPVPTGALQRDVDPAYRGRVMSVHQVAHLGNRPFSALATGAIAGAFGLAVAAIAAVALIPIGAAALRRGSAGRRTGDEPAAAPVA